MTMIEVVVNDEFFDHHNCEPKIREYVKDYLVCEFLGMANQTEPPEDKLVELNTYLHTHFPELFDPEEIKI